MSRFFVMQNFDSLLFFRYTSIFQSIYHVVSNPTFLFLTLAGTLDTGLVVGLSTFGPKYLESMFNVTATQAATYFGDLSTLLC